MEAGFWRQKHFRKRMAKAADGKGQRTKASNRDLLGLAPWCNQVENEKRAA
jgi:hypothetical protein